MSLPCTKQTEIELTKSLRRDELDDGDRMQEAMNYPNGSMRCRGEV